MKQGVAVTEVQNSTDGRNGTLGFAPEQIDDLMSNMRSTAGSRFAAAKRLEHRDRSLTRLTAFASGYIIILTVLPYILKTDVRLTDKINLATIAIAVVILVSSLLQYSSGDVLKAEQFHRSALELKELRREIKARRSTMSANEFLSDSAKYSRILEKYAVNHDDIDYLRYQLENARDFEIGDWKARIGHVRLKIANSRPAIALLAVTALCLGLGFYGLTRSSQSIASGPAILCSNCVVKIMIQVQSSLFPLYDRNPQTFVPNIFLAKKSDYKSATVTIVRGGTSASAVWLPVVPLDQADALAK